MSDSVLSAWPEAMDLETIGAYTSTTKSTARDWVNDGLLVPLKLPGTFLRDKNGRVVTRPRDHRLNKIIVLKSEVDALLARCKGGE